MYVYIYNYSVCVYVNTCIVTCFCSFCFSWLCLVIELKIYCFKDYIIKTSS